MNDPTIDRKLLRKLVAQLRFAFDRGLVAQTAQPNWNRETENVLLRAEMWLRQSDEVATAPSRVENGQPDWKGTCPHYGCDNERVARGHCAEHDPLLEFVSSIDAPPGVPVKAICMRNGMMAVFDALGHQVPEWQGLTDEKFPGLQRAFPNIRVEQS